MTEIQRIVDQLNRAFEGEAWHGPALMNILGGIKPLQAASRPFPGTHSIWEIALHIAAWERACCRRLGGERAELPAVEDWPEVTNTNEQSWQRAKTVLRQAHDELCDAVSQLDESRLDEPIIEGMGSVYVTVHGVIQHSLYHAGQIALLKKSASEQEIV